MTQIFFSLGVFLCFFGLIGLCIVIYLGFQIQKQTKIHSEVEKKNIFEKLIVLNYLALFSSAFGIIILVIGIFLT